MASCGVCKLIIDRAYDNKIKCNDCSQIFHGDCARLTKTDIEFMKDKKQLWFCSICLKKRRNIKHNEPVISPRLKSTSEAEINSQSSADILNVIASLRQEFADQFSALHERISLLEDKFFNKMDGLIKVNDDLRKENLKLHARLSNVEQFHFNTSIDIVGLPVVKEHELLPSVVNMLNVCLNVNVADSDIDSIYNVGQSNASKKLPDIVQVRFIRKHVKDSIMRAKKGNKNLSTAQLGESPGKLIFINHSLCAAKRKIFAEAWKLKKSKKCHHVWYSNGRICLKKDEHSKISVIDTISDLDELYNI